MLLSTNRNKWLCVKLEWIYSIRVYTVIHANCESTHWRVTETVVAKLWSSWYASRDLLFTTVVNQSQMTLRKRKRYKNADVSSIAKLESDWYECSQRSHYILSKMQKTSSSHSKPIQAWKTACLGKRRTPPRTREKRLWWAKIPASTRIRQNH